MEYFLSAIILFVLVLFVNMTSDRYYKLTKRIHALELELFKMKLEKESR